VTLYDSYFGSGTPTLAAGNYVLAGSGGHDVGAFSSGVTFPGDFVWTNMDTTGPGVQRNAGLPVNWTGGSGMVTISGISATQIGGTEADPVYRATGFVCQAPAAALTFTVPSSILQQLPAVSSNSDSDIVSFGTLTVLATSSSTFSAPLVVGGNIDQGFFVATSGSYRSVNWQ
jgi:hypothetical protein